MHFFSPSLLTFYSSPSLSLSLSHTLFLLPSSLLLSHPLSPKFKIIKQRCCHNNEPSINSTDEVCLTSPVSPWVNCTLTLTCPGCDPCYTSWKHAVSQTVWVAGSFGLIFSLTQVNNYCERSEPPSEVSEINAVPCRFILYVYINLVPRGQRANITSSLWFNTMTSPGNA